MKVKLLIAGICMVLCGMLVPFAEVSAEESEIKTAQLTDEEFRDILEVQISSLVSTRATSYSLDWKVPAKTRYVTGYFEKSKDSTVQIVVNLSKSGRAGILRFNGTAYYSEGKSISTSFKIPATDSYCVFIQNTNSESIKGLLYKIAAVFPAAAEKPEEADTCKR